ncbi:hypothetical protein ymoll0001_11900 [Yersinia mollaretii ATCC 43969]|uniref:Uncharacterized protein n=1 Tax=Yersinia mollaretii (strain ATCC 43969 / DSM 18520 / CIP 103324 / CNY 7263 / WAIP 204) TaxID=349967 RepID=A0ABP2EJ92_YERMW|nr:hypothetical protein ymoll0001_11900 [Yersinia mollaretii ATCC 43969]
MADVIVHWQQVSYFSDWLSPPPTDISPFWYGLIPNFIFGL